MKLVNCLFLTKFLHLFQQELKSIVELLGTKINIKNETSGQKV